MSIKTSVTETTGREVGGPCDVAESRLVHFLVVASEEPDQIRDPRITYRGGGLSAKIHYVGRLYRETEADVE